MAVRPDRPADPLRALAAAELLPAAHAAARRAGVTRLADITRLDVIGLPVWQAIRPASRALSVHQGKGWTAAEAQLGALLEAVESDAAEGFAAPVTASRWSDLPPDLQPPPLADVAADRDRPPDESVAIDWVLAERLDGAGAMALPFDLVSLDFTRRTPSPFDRASNGVATGSSREEALVAALHEIVERDAMAEWQAAELEERMACMVDPASVGAAWFEHLSQAILSAGARLRCYAVPSVTGTPVFACEISDPGKAARPFRATSGHGAHPWPEVALFRAVTEAIQSRAAFIAGARDDLYPWRYEDPRAAIDIAYGLPLPMELEPIAFASVAKGPATLPALLSALASAGFPDAVAVTLAEPEGLCVVRTFVSGLGSVTRRRAAR